MFNYQEATPAELGKQEQKNFNILIQQVKEEAVKNGFSINSEEELIEYTSKHYQHLHDNGRINSGIHTDGQWLSLTTSPEHKQFLSNIEKNIQPLVSLLYDFGLLTYSSCQGHSLYDERFVGIAFTSRKQQKDFLNILKNINIKKYKIIEFEIFETVYHSTINDENDDEFNLLDIIQKETTNFNIIFNQNIPRYFFTEIFIGRYSSQQEMKNFIFRSLKLNRNLIMNLFINELRQHLENSESFVKNKI